MIKTGEKKLRDSPMRQTIKFNGQEDQNSAVIYSADVNVISSSGGHDQGSSKVILKNIVDFTWEHKYYSGQLLAIHMSGKYLAYGIIISGGNTLCPAVRVVNKQTEKRMLLKGMKVSIKDLAFAHISNVILACVDYTGSLYVHTIEDTANELICERILQVDDNNSSITSHRVIWCPYIPEDGQSLDDDDASKLLVLTRGSKAELWSVNAASKQWNHPIQENDPQIRESGVMVEINQHSGTIIEAAFSPDGTALATASSNGEVAFFQISTSMSNSPQKQTKCIHTWKPHGDQPISSLFFLDDHKACQPDAQFWHFAITGCNFNTELKLWSCELWRCLQTITISPSPSATQPSCQPLILKANLDLSSNYLILSDIYNKILYILNLSKNNEKSLACVETISEFLLPYPILSFAIIDAGKKKIRTSGEFLDDLGSGEDECEEEEMLAVKMYLVQPKSLQECNITFKPAVLASRPCLTNDNDRIEDILKLNHNGLLSENGDSNHTTETNDSAGLNLMTPDAFSSPAKKDLSNNLDSQESPELAPEATLETEPSLAIVSEKQAPPSGGSSPSREVREILSLLQPDDIDSENKNENLIEQQDLTSWLKSKLMIVHGGAREIIDEEGAADKSDAQIFRDSAKVTGNAKLDYKLSVMNNNYFVLRDKIDTLCQTIQEDRREINQLRHEISRLRQESSNVSLIESAVSRVMQQENTNLNQTFYNHLTREHDLINSMESVLKEMIENTVPGVVENITEPFKHQLRLDFVQMDELIREKHAKLLNSALVPESLARSAATAVKNALDSTFKEVFTTNLLPILEKTCESMFRQIEDSFVRGTKQYLLSADGIIDKKCQRRNEAQQELISSAIKREIQSELGKGLSVIQENTMRTIRDSLRDNFTQHMSDVSGMCSRATTPAISVTSSADTHTAILNLLQRRQLNAAFQKALSASDLNLVMLVCERTDPADVFSCPGPEGSRCILAQPVILSLVQQLSADFTNQPQLKYKWLEEAILNLDPNDPVTREHMGGVLMPMQNQLAAFLHANPNHKYERRMKVLAMAARALLNRKSHH